MVRAGLVIKDRKATAFELIHAIDAHIELRPRQRHAHFALEVACPKRCALTLEVAQLRDQGACARALANLGARVRTRSPSLVRGRLDAPLDQGGQLLTR